MSSSTPELTAAVVTVSDSSSRGERRYGRPCRIGRPRKEKFQNRCPGNRSGRRTGDSRSSHSADGSSQIHRDNRWDGDRQTGCDARSHARRVRAAARRDGGTNALGRRENYQVCCVEPRHLRHARESIILNLPGKPSGAVESLEAVVDLIPHALQLLSGNTKHE